MLNDGLINLGKDLAEGEEKDEEFFTEPSNETNKTWDKDDDGSTDNKEYVPREALRRSKQQSLKLR